MKGPAVNVGYLGLKPFQPARPGEAMPAPLGYRSGSMTSRTAPHLEIVPIAPEHDAAIGKIIRATLAEFGAVGQGYSAADAEVDHMSEAYGGPGHCYDVVLLHGAVVGGGGIAPLDHGPADHCELRKMYFLPAARGLGAGRRLLTRCLDHARSMGYRYCYLETLAGMTTAQRLYTSVGFTRLPGPLGNTGHFNCDTFFGLELD
jgi:putative acetyltransferase